MNSSQNQVASSPLSVTAGFGNWTQAAPTEPGYYWMRFYIEGDARDTKIAAIRRGTVDMQMQCGDGSWVDLCNFGRCWWSGPLLPPALPADKIPGRSVLYRTPKLPCKPIQQVARDT